MIPIKNSHKKIFLILAFALAVIGLAILFFSPPQKAATDKLSVAASFYPLYFFASEIGGDKADVLNITPSGAEPHDFEPAAQDIAKIYNSKLLILNGLDLESWGNNIQKNVDPKKTTITIAGQGFDNPDPHLWLGPPTAMIMVKNILEGFLRADPANAIYYKASAAALKIKLEELDSAYRAGLAGCPQKNFITSHAAFGYLASVYDLKQIAIAGLSPDAEPSPAQLTEIVDAAKAENIKYVFYESLGSPKLAQTIAREIGAETLPLNTLEGLTEEDAAQGQNYFTEMQNNLINLQIALECRK